MTVDFGAVPLRLFSMKRLSASLMVGAFLMFCAATPETGQIRGKVHIYGIMTSAGPGLVKNGSEASPGAGKAADVQVQIKSATNRIPAVLHTRFGFVYSLTNLPVANGNMTVTKIVKHPKMKRPTGDSPTGSISDEPITVRNGGAIAITGYAFDNEYELVPGIWDFEIKYKDNLICTQRFTVFKP